MGIFDKRKERDKEKSESPAWVAAYMPSYSFSTNSKGEPLGSFAINEGVSMRLLKKPKDFYEETDKFIGILISTTENKIIGEVDYDKLIKQMEKFQIDETKEEMLIRELTNQEIHELSQL